MENNIRGGNAFFTRCLDMHHNSVDVFQSHDSFGDPIPAQTATTVRKPCIRVAWCITADLLLTDLTADRVYRKLPGCPSVSPNRSRPSLVISFKSLLAREPDLVLMSPESADHFIFSSLEKYLPCTHTTCGL